MAQRNCYKIYQDSQGEWRWTYYGANGEEIAVSSEGYKDRADCRRSVEIMKGSSGHPEC